MILITQLMGLPSLLPAKDGTPGVPLFRDEKSVLSCIFRMKGWVSEV